MLNKLSSVKLIHTVFFSVFFVLISLPEESMAQSEKTYVSFDGNPVHYKKKESEKTGSLFDVLLRSFSKGIRGKSLDLTKNAALRMPVQLLENSVPDYRSSFSVQIWVKTLEDANLGSPVIGNKENTKAETPGWLINSREDGGWELQISKGSTNWNYSPTLKNQRINDGKWHQITFTADLKKDEIWIYFDGKNVAVYNTPRISRFNTKWATTIGGLASEWDYYGQENAFNGYLDEVKIWDRLISPQEVKESYLEFFPSADVEPVFYGNEIRYFTWNIWVGGRRMGKKVNLERIIETIKAERPDVVTLIETYGSGEEIADALGFYFYLISSNLSIMTRFPIKETIKEFKPFNFGGAVLEVRPGKDLVVLDTWLNYLPDYSGNINKGKLNAKQLVKDEQKTRVKEIKSILKEIKPLLDNADRLPVIMSGDFNTNSHLDWIELTKHYHRGYVVPWPVTIEMEKAGFTDSFREINPDPLIDPGFSYWPYSKETDKSIEHSRIDFIFYKGKNLKAVDSKVIDYHPVMFPSDHMAFLTVFKLGS